jgi:putative FmdB family regulatory protein
LPLYEYECTKCKHHFEMLQKFSDKPAKVCVRCGAPAQRLISSPAIQFKGTGWYVTDYGKGSASTEGGKERKPASADSAKDSAKEKAPAPAASESSKPKETASPSSGTPKP